MPHIAASTPTAPRAVVMIDPATVLASANTSNHIDVAELSQANLFVTFEGAAAGDSLIIDIEVSPRSALTADEIAAAVSDDEWYSLSAAAVTFVAGSRAETAIQKERLTYESESGDPELFVYTIQGFAGVERLRVIASSDEATATVGIVARLGL